MKVASLIILFTISLTGLNAQSNDFINSLKTNSSNSIVVFEDNCVGCIVMNPPCEEYTNGGKPKDKYIIWKNDKGFYIKRFNICGSSNTVTIKRWPNDPFEIISSKSRELDTTSLKYPLSLDRNDMTWFETGINHYKYYHFQFPTDSIGELTIKDYAFREQKDDDEVWALIDNEFKKNLGRYEFNKTTAIKELLDCLISTINKNDKKLKITNANNGYK